MIVNKKAVFPHINNYQLRAATVEIDQKMAGQTLQIVVTAAMNDAINKAQKIGGKANIQHVKLALRGNFADGKALNPDDAKLLKAVGSIVAKYKELELTEDGFLQVKGAPKMVDADIKVTAKNEPKQPKEDVANADQIKAQQDEIAALKAELEAAKTAKEEAAQVEKEQPEVVETAPKEAKKSNKKADKETSKEDWASAESGAA
jgi:hypothetical protein